MNNAARLENWCVVSRGWLGFEPPERERICLHGTVTGHPRCADGKEITTSMVVARNGHCVVTKSGNEYELGRVDAAFEMAFPEARRRLLDRLSVIVAVSD